MATPRGYCSVAEIGARLGCVVEDGQDAQVLAAIAATEAAIDRHTGRVWLGGSAPVSESHYRPGALLRLRRAPVTSLTVAARSSLAATPTPLVADQGYELQDADTGMLWLASADWDRVSVAVVANQPVPADVAEATREIVVALLLPALRPDALGVAQLRFGDVTVSYQDLTAADWPAAARTLLASYRRWVMA